MALTPAFHTLTALPACLQPGEAAVVGVNYWVKTLASSPSLSWCIQVGFKRETPSRQEGTPAGVDNVLIIYHFLGMKTSTEMTWSKMPFLGKSPATQ